MRIFGRISRFKLAIIAGAVGCMGAVAPASATPLLFGSSYYDFVVDDGISWSDANTAAGTLTFGGSNGHLATITSSEEDGFLQGLVSPYVDFAGAWIGASVQGDADGTWEVGPEAGDKFSVYGYENWGGVEPNDLNNNARAYMNIGSVFAGIATGEWADSANGLSSSGNPIKGYFVEFQVATTPIPAALPLFAAALGGLGFFGWRRRKSA
jgi:hypothetical protein